MEKEKVYINDFIEGCKKYDRRSQQQLYMYFYEAMMNMCVRYTKNEQDAEHVLNAAFFRVFKSIEQYNPAKGSLYTWVHKIVTNCCIYYIKSKHRNIETIELENISDLHIEPEIFAKMNDATIIQLVRNLPPATQAVFNMYVVDGYKHKEIAKFLEVSENTSKWHLNEARKRLKQDIHKK